MKVSTKHPIVLMVSAHCYSRLWEVYLLNLISAGRRPKEKAFPENGFDMNKGLQLPMQSFTLNNEQTIYRGGTL